MRSTLRTDRPHLIIGLSLMACAICNYDWQIINKKITANSMKCFSFCVAVVASLLAACASSSATKLPAFATPKHEIADAKRAFRASGHDFLSLLLVDRSGKVVKAERLASKLDTGQQNYAVLKAMYDVKFKPATGGDSAFREFILPYSVDQTVEHEADERFLRTYDPGVYMR